MAFRKLGEFIKLVSERNINGQFSEVLGISIDKEFMPSVANIIGTDLTKYYVIRKNRFAFNPMHVGRDERLPISCYKRENPALVSPAYQMFEITDDNINSDYLMLVFKSSEFDRNCWFHTDSSVRGGISWNDFCKMEINVPDIAEQERVVKIYNVINNRIKILNALNKNLEEQAQTIFKHWFIDNGDYLDENKYVSLDTLVDVIDNRGKNPPLVYKSTNYPIIDIKALSGNNRIINFNNCSKFVTYEIYSNWFRNGHPKSWDILISTVGSIAEMKLFLGQKGCIAQNIVSFRSKKISPVYLYQYLNFIRKDLLNYNIGSVQPSIKVSQIIKHLIFLPKDESLNKFDNVAKSLSIMMYNYSFESQKLAELRELLLPKLLS